MAASDTTLGNDESELLFSRLLRRLRDRGGFSQEALAVTASTTPRYISFLENGRANASRDMIYRLAAALELDDYDRSRMWEAAGYMPHANMPPIDSETFEETESVVQRILTLHSPNPGFFLDRDFNVLGLNEAGESLLRLCGYTARAESLQGFNLMETTFDPEGLRPAIRNWKEHAVRCLRHLTQEALLREEPRHLLTRLREFPDVQELEAEPQPDGGDRPASRLVVSDGNGDQTFLALRGIIGDHAHSVAYQFRVQLLYPEFQAELADPIAESVNRP